VEILLHDFALATIVVMLFLYILFYIVGRNATEQRKKQLQRLSVAVVYTGLSIGVLSCGFWLESLRLVMFGSFAVIGMASIALAFIKQNGHYMSAGMLAILVGVITIFLL